MASTIEFESHVGNVIVTVWLNGDLVMITERMELPLVSQTV